MLYNYEFNMVLNQLYEREREMLIVKNKLPIVLTFLYSSHIINGVCQYQK